MMKAILRIPGALGKSFWNHLSAHELMIHVHDVPQILLELSNYLLLHSNVLIIILGPAASLATRALELYR